MERTALNFANKKLNWDDDLDRIPLGDSRNRIDQVYPTGDNSVLENRRELTEIAHTLPSGTNTVIGTCQDYENNAIIYFVSNSNNNDCIIRMYSDNSFENISYAKDWGFSTSYYIHDAFIVGTGDDALLCFNDYYNPARCVNIANLIAGNYPNIKFNEVELYFPAPIYRPELTLGSDSSYTANFLRGKLIQFAYSYINDKEQESAISQWSEIVVDYQDSFDRGIFNSDITISNKIDIVLKTGLSHYTGDLSDSYDNLVKIKLYIKIADIGVGQSGSWKLYDTLDLTDSNYHDNAYYYTFYNDKLTLGVDQTSFLALEENIPLLQRSMTLINGERIGLGGLNRKYDNPTLDMSLTHLDTTSLVYLNYYLDVVTVYGFVATVYHYIDIDLLAPIITGNILWEVFIQQINPTTGLVTGEETYSYQYTTTSTYSGKMSNTDVVTALVSQINSLTNFGITASSISGGHPNKLRITCTDWNDATKTYYVCFIPKTCYPILPTFRENKQINFAIKYIDKYGRSWNISLDGLSIKMPYKSSTTVSGYAHGVEYTINHAPPSDAVAWQMLISDTNYPNSFVVPCIFDNTFLYGQLSDLEHTGTQFKLNLPQALERCVFLNPATDLNAFSPQKGDRLRIFGYVANFQDLTNNTPIPFYFCVSENIDLQILDVDVDGKLIIESLNGFSEYSQFNHNAIYYVQIYRDLLDIDQENLIYKEIGPVNAIVNGYHIPNDSSISAPSFTKQDQTAYDGTGPAIGMIDYGELYMRPVHFCNIIVDQGGNGNGYVLTPIMSFVPCKNSSFAYDSEARSTGRSDYYKDNYKNEIVEKIVYSGILKNGTTNYNELNRFRDDPYSDINQKDGQIIKMRQVGYVLRVYQEKNIIPIYVNRQLITDAAGNQTLQYTQNVLGDANPLNYNVGCTHAGSFASNHDNDYFWCNNKSAWYRFGQNGLMNITEANEQDPNAFKMKAYGIYIGKLINTSIKAAHNPLFTSGFDPVKNMYVFSFIDTYGGSEYQITLAFHEPTNSWLSWYSIWHENFISFNKNRFFSFLGGKLYEHHISDTYVTTGQVQFHFNPYAMEGIRKLFWFIHINSDQKMAPTSEGDILIDENSVATQNPNSYEWNYAKMSSLLKEAHFIVYEGEFRAIFKRNMLNKKGVLNGKVSLLNGELLRGKTMSITLRNAKSSKNTLRSVTIGWEKSK